MSKKHGSGFKKAMRGLLEVKAYLSGELKLTAREARPLPLPKMTATDVTKIREQMQASQAAFAGILNVSEKTVQAWESGARSPRGAALKLLAVASRHPEVLLEPSRPLIPTPTNRGSK